MIKYTFHNPCQKKCKQVINQAITYQILKYYLKFNDQYGHFFWIYVNDIEESHV
jgi:hypothetical protein